MITENYLQIMIDSLLKKIEILKKVSELNEQQSALLDDKEFDGDKLQSNMESKATYIDELNSLDEGFQAVFDRVKEDVEEYKADYKELIIRLQELIREATSLSATIQAQESRNKVRVDIKFRQLKDNAKTAKRSVSMANKYYQNMSRVSSSKLVCRRTTFINFSAFTVASCALESSAWIAAALSFSSRCSAS